MTVNRRSNSVLLLATWGFMCFFGYLKAFGQDAQWDSGFLVEKPRSNPFGWDPDTLGERVKEGRHAFFEYPVKATGSKIPYRLFEKVYVENPWNPISILVRFALAGMSGSFGVEAVFEYLGLTKLSSSKNPQKLPFPKDDRVRSYLGASILKTSKGDGLTFSCAACHVSSLFGTAVLGLASRFPKANDFLLSGKNFVSKVDRNQYHIYFGNDLDSVDMLMQLKHNMQFVNGKKPLAASLDTSLAQVGLSLALRDEDGYASRNGQRERRRSVLETQPADSKPTPWWNAKYKNRWLSDGAVVSGNPVLTNIIWNELGRGSSLRDIEEWISQNQDTIENMTAAIFATEAPRYVDFFQRRFSFEDLEAGRVLFERSCSSCHGSYKKAWEQISEKALRTSSNAQYRELTKTLQVSYHESTPVVDVGTDPFRYMGMSAFSDQLNRLVLSKAYRVKVVPQKGYIPPPLVGVWARWPYLHNNSIANLCELLTVESQRSSSYWAGAAKNKRLDYDQECLGYPIKGKTPKLWRLDPSKYFDARVKGLSNIGHSKGILERGGEEVFSVVEKKQLLRFLSTL